MAEEKKPAESSVNNQAGKEETKKEEVEIPKKFQKLVDEIEKMSVSDLAELVKILEKKFGVSSVPQVVAQAPAGAPAGGEGGEEKSSFNIELTDVGSKKIDVIKAYRDVTQKGLKESKDAVDAAEKGEAQTVKENVKKEEAGEIKKKFEEAGAKVELK